ncbi:MAG: F0F1 ATP synthase subunit B [Nitrospirota bacterium]
MNIEIQQILTQMAGFLLLVWVLKKFAWKHLLSLLDERRERISSQFSEIEKTKEDVSRLKSEYEVKTAEIESNSQAKINEAVLKGDQIARDIQEKARTEYQEIIERAGREIEREKDRAIVELKEKIVDLSVTVASKVIDNSLKKEDHLKLVDRYIQEVGQSYGKE